MMQQTIFSVSDILTGGVIDLEVKDELVVTPYFFIYALPSLNYR